jgi:hypothetical protein
MERDLIKARAAIAAADLERTSKARSLAATLLEEEIDAAAEVASTPQRVPALQFSAACVSSARDDLARVREEERSAEQRVTEEVRELVAAHRRVRQLELVVAQIEGRIDEEANRVDLRESDDLVARRGAAI